MAVAGRPSPVRHITVEEAVRGLRREIMQYERIYEMPSGEMLALLRRGERNDTAEISVWMIKYRSLLDLESGKSRGKYEENYSYRAHTNWSGHARQ